MQPGQDDAKKPGIRPRRRSAGGPAADRRRTGGTSVLVRSGAGAGPRTPDYARTSIRKDNPGVDDDEIERRVHVRIVRQALLTRVTAAPHVDVALNEAVLRRPVGGDKVMAEQLERLVHLNELDNVSIRVVPYTAGSHDGIMSGPFVMMRFPTNGDGRETEPPTVYVEGFTGALYLDRPNEIERYRI
ncbi:DUF5753 domain-containing protein [Streptomyces scopuliridis]|uniref:DUF5753 domain-containing protein n=1 Tax=Streptomyces scopuliridis TaxID=452529 RepID=UPI0036A02BE5